VNLIRGRGKGGRKGKRGTDSQNTNGTRAHDRVTPFGWKKDAGSDVVKIMETYSEPIKGTSDRKKEMSKKHWGKWRGATKSKFVC